MEEELICFGTRRDGKSVRGQVFVPEPKDRKYPTVIICHGFGADYRMFMHHGEGLRDEGICTVMFDFCGGGYGSLSDGTTLEMSALTEDEDLSLVLDKVLGYEFVDKKKVFLLGESQGGFVVSITGQKRMRDIAGLILWYPAFVIPDYVRDLCKEGIPDEYEVMGVKIGRIYAEDVINLYPYKTMKKFKKPVLIIHGDRDDIVPISYSQRAAGCYPDVEFLTISNAGHGFNGDDSLYARERTRDFVYEVCGRHEQGMGKSLLKRLFALLGKSGAIRRNNG